MGNSMEKLTQTLNHKKFCDFNSSSFEIKLKERVKIFPISIHLGKMFYSKLISKEKENFI